MLTRKLLTAAILTTGFAAFAGSVYATPIVGSIDVSGLSTTHTATSVTFLNPADILAVEGDFSELGPMIHTCSGCVTMGTPFSTGSSLPFTLFSGMNNGDSVSLAVTSDTFTDLGGGALRITGMGTVSLTGFDDTTGFFSLTIPSSGLASFDIKTTVPEPGTLALFGAGLLGCALFMRRRRSPNV